MLLIIIAMSVSESFCHIRIQYTKISQTFFDVSFYLPEVTNYNKGTMKPLPRYVSNLCQ